MAEEIIVLDSTEEISSLLGSRDEFLLVLIKELDVTAVTRDGELKISGENSNIAKSALQAARQLIAQGRVLDEQTLRYCIGLAKAGKTGEIASLSGDLVAVTIKGKPVYPKTLGQKQYIEAIKGSTITFGIGPAGTGKTYLAVALAVKALKAHEVSRIILTRPAVEAGEKLGFLPGDLQNKVDPYLRPLYDGLYDMLGTEVFGRMLEKGQIEVAPLAYMRGRTLDESYIILDEAQNTTPEQMKMFLTRLGNGSRMIITGDVTQIDLPDKIKSGLVEAAKITENIDGVKKVILTGKDVVRHHIVEAIVSAYEKHESQAKKRKVGNERQGLYYRSTKRD